MTRRDGSAQRAVQRARGLWPGMLAAAVIAMAAVFVGNQHGGPVLLYALLLGSAFSFLSDQEPTAAGVDLTAKRVLQLGVALLGARIGVDSLIQLGWPPVVLVVGAVTASLAVGGAMARALGLSRDQGLLTGGAVGICGASAALAISSVLPRSQHLERNTVFTVVGVTTLGTLTMIVYPPLLKLAGWEATRAGLFVGGTIHDVAQVVGAGYMISDHAGDTATVTKLLRVAMLVPVVLVIASLVRERAATAAGPGASWQQRLPLPPFLIAFVVIAGLNSGQLIPASVQAGAETVSRWCLVAAIAAIGMKTRVQSLLEIGWRPVALMLAETAVMAGLFAAAILAGIVQPA